MRRMHQINRPCQGGKSLAQFGDRSLSLLREDQAAAGAAKQLHTQILLQPFDLLADRSRGDVQLGRRLADAAVPCGGFEGT